MDDLAWEILGRIDIIFGVLGGIIMVGGFIRHFFVLDLQPSDSYLPFWKDKVFSLFQVRFEYAYTPIKYISIFTAILVLFNLPNSTLGIARTVAIIMATLISVFVGLISGAITSKLFRHSLRKTTQSSVVGASILAFTTTIFDPLADIYSSGVWIGPILASSIIGGILGAVLDYLWRDSFASININIKRFLSVLKNSFGFQMYTPRVSAAPEWIQSKAPLELTDVEEPIQKYKSDGLNVIIKFKVANHGSATRVNPHVKFKIAMLASGKLHEKVVESGSDWLVHVPARTVQPMSFTTVIGDRSTHIVKDSLEIVLYAKPFN